MANHQRMRRKTKTFHGFFDGFLKAQIKFWHVKKSRRVSKADLERQLSLTIHVTTWQAAGFETSSCGHAHFVYSNPCYRCAMRNSVHSPSPLRKGFQVSPTSGLHRCSTHTCRGIGYSSKPTLSGLGRVLHLAVPPMMANTSAGAQYDWSDRGIGILDHRP